MKCVVAKRTKHLMWKIRMLAPVISIVFVLGSAPVFARGGGHSGEGHGEVATRADMVVTQVAREDTMEVIPATSMEGLQAAVRRGAIS